MPHAPQHKFHGPCPQNQGNAAALQGRTACEIHQSVPIIVIWNKTYDVALSPTRACGLGHPCGITHAPVGAVTASWASGKGPKLGITVSWALWKRSKARVRVVTDIGAARARRTTFVLPSPLHVHPPQGRQFPPTPGGTIAKCPPPPPRPGGIDTIANEHITAAYYAFPPGFPDKIHLQGTF